MKKRYYSPVREYDTYKRRHIFFKGLKTIIRVFYPKNQWVWKTEKPDGEPCFFVCNHTKIYAPTEYIVHKKNSARVWANYYFLYLDSCWNHVKNKVLPFVKAKWILYPVAWLLVPFIVLIFRAFEPIPVFHKSEKVKTMTFQKSIETLKSGQNQVIFPERTVNQVNRYVFQFNHGFPKVAERYYRETGKILRFYPVYCAEKLRTFVVGEPVSYDPTEDMSTQADKICHRLEEEIGKLGDGLPEHEPVLYA